MRNAASIVLTVSLLAGTQGSLSAATAAPLEEKMTFAAASPVIAGRWRSAQRLVDARNERITVAAHTPEENYEPNPYQPYSANVTLYPNGRIRSTTATDYGGNTRTVEYTYNSSGALTQIKETLASCLGEMCVTDQKIQGFGLDSRGRFARRWKVDTGMPTLNYNYWYGSNPNVRYYRAVIAGTNTQYGVGQETFDSAGRVISEMFRQTSSNTGYSYYDYAFGTHRYPTTGQNFLTRKRFAYTTSGGRPVVRENVWFNTATTNPPDQTLTHRGARGVRLLERHTWNSFSSGRAHVETRYTLWYAYNV